MRLFIRVLITVLERGFRRNQPRSNTVLFPRQHVTRSFSLDLRMSVPLPKVIIDTDAGLDDALAIFMALAAHKQKLLEIIAITTVHGNTGVHNVNNNVLRILKTANLLEEIPVYCGASSSLVHPWKHDNDPFHGHDGFGDATHAMPPPPLSHLQEEHAVMALLRLTKKYPNEVIVAALGPLTNLALATRLDPNLLSSVADVYIMGGNTTGEGNITMCGEFNFTCDPEAAKVVLEEAQQPVYLTPWEICLHQTGLPYAVRQELGSTNTPEAELMNIIEAKVNQRRAFSCWITCDQLAMAWLIDNVKKQNSGMKSQGEDITESLCNASKQCFATVELQGSHTRGQMVIDHTSLSKRPPNVTVLTAVNMPLYQRYLKMAFGGQF